MMNEEDSPQEADSTGRHASPPELASHMLGVSVEERIKSHLQRVFPFPYFNRMQSKVIDSALDTDNPLAISAPTGTGKTVILELAIIRLLDHPQAKNSLEKYGSKVVYLAPTKALCAERAADWKVKFGPLGLKLIELTSDHDYDTKLNLLLYDIIITTPEKWDFITRSWRSGTTFNFIRHIKLILIDEVHLINSGQRGATLEVVISRMKTIRESFVAESSSEIPLRFVAISATCPNIDDIANWFSSDSVKGEPFTFGEDYRPVPLQYHVFGYPMRESTNDYLFEQNLTYRLPDLISDYSDGKPVLIFCSTRRGVETTAIKLMENMRFPFGAIERQEYQQLSMQVKDASLRKSIAMGIAFHHAGLTPQDRKLVEENFINGTIFVLVCTSTLAMGVNLPAHLVIIKGTNQYLGGRFESYGATDVIQMLGRAGRPQFDKDAVAIVMTKVEQREKYEAMIKGSQCVESSLQDSIIEQLNAEVVLGTISDLETAYHWLQSTYFYIRILKNPTFYRAPNDLSKEKLDKQAYKWLVTKVKELNSDNLVKITSGTCDFHLDEDTCTESLAKQIAVKPTESGRLMSRWGLRASSVAKFNTLSGTENLCQLLSAFCRLYEISGDMQVRHNEKKDLNELNNNPAMRYKFNGKVTQSSIKAMVLVQAVLGQATIVNASLQQEAYKIIRSAQRVSRALVEFAQINRMKGFRLFVCSLILCKCIRVEMWDNSPFVSRQLKKVGAVISQHLANAGYTSFAKIADSDHFVLASCCNKSVQFAIDLRESARKMPQYQISMAKAVTRKRVNYKVTIRHVNQNSMYAPDPYHSLIFVAGHEQNNSLVYFRRVREQDFYKGSEPCVTISFPSLEDNPITVYLISELYAGIDVKEIFASGSEATSEGVQQPEDVSLLDDSGLGDSFIEQEMITARRVKNPTNNQKTHSRQTKLNFQPASQLIKYTSHETSTGSDYGSFDNSQSISSVDSQDFTENHDAGPAKRSHQYNEDDWLEDDDDDDFDSGPATKIRRDSYEEGSRAGYNFTSQPRNNLFSYMNSSYQ